MKRTLTFILLLLLLFSMATSAVPVVHAEKISADWSFITIEDKTINQNTYNDKTVLLVFYRALMNNGEGVCNNSNSIISSLSECYWIGNPSIKVIAVDIDDVSKNEVKDYKITYAPNCNDIIFCYNGGSVFWDLFSLTNNSGSAYLAHCMIFKDGVIKESWGQNYSAEDCKRKLFNYVNLGTDPSYDYTQISGQFCQTEARKQLSMINSFRTQKSVWYWNSDNSTKTYFNQSGSESLSSLTYDYELEQVAMARARELALYYGCTHPHYRPTGEYFHTLYYKDTSSYGENIAAGYMTSTEAFTAWREDDEYYYGQGHRRNMLNGDFTAVGFGCYCYNGYYYWTQEFGYENSGAASTTANDSKDSYRLEYKKDLFIPRIDSIECSGGVVYLEWTYSSFANSYRVLRSIAGTGDWTVIGETNNQSLSDYDVDDGMVYQYTIRSLDWMDTHVHDYDKGSESIAVGMKTGWKQISGKWYYVKNDGKLAKRWLSISGKWYYFDTNGIMQIGWKQISGKWYYFNTNGTMQIGWQKINSKWYYFESSGAMITGWKQISGKWYYFNTNGVMQTGWQKINSKWYYLESGGAMATGWKQVSGKWYYFNINGAMQTGWQKINSKWYYLESGGAMVTGWKQISGKWYYFETSGVMVQNASKTIGGKTYNFNSSGICTNP